ncbi:MAG TPA: ATP-binding cassette domain-containing protein [Acidimicrobiales bacterium]|nr:ATP-binding cassette domain-containing protein [Acidimicrobiales bacterium]
MGIELSQVAKSYGSVLAVRGIDLTIAPGETVALLGPNGAGKTTPCRRGAAADGDVGHRRTLGQQALRRSEPAGALCGGACRRPRSAGP